MLSDWVDPVLGGALAIGIGVGMMAGAVMFGPFNGDTAIFSIGALDFSVSAGLLAIWAVGGRRG